MSEQRNTEYSNATGSPRRRILFLAHRLPYPAIGGDRVKSYHLLKHLSQIADLDIIALDEANDASPEALKALQAFGKIESVPFNTRTAVVQILKALPTSTPIEYAYYHSAEMQAAVDRALHRTKYDLVIAFFLRTAEYLAHYAGPKLLIAEDARVLLQERATEKFSFSPEYAVRRIDRARLSKYEPRTMQGFNRVTFVAKEDEARIKRSDPTLPTSILTNGVDTAYFAFRSAEEKNTEGKNIEAESAERKQALLFCGHLGVYHNRLMVERLATTIFPALREKFHDLALWVVGKEPSKKMEALLQATSGATLFANVPDVRPYLYQASLFVHPQYVGAGIQNKVLEAMAAGIPVVTTPIGSSGIEGVRNGKELMIAQNDAEIIASSTILLEQEEKARALAEQARALIEREYTWQKIYHDLDRVIEEIVPGFFLERVAESNFVLA